MIKYFLKLMLLLCFVEVCAQNKIITGKVIDSQKKPLLNINVRVKGTDVVVSTLRGGLYTITIPDNNKILVFSAEGYQTKEVNVGIQSNIDVSIYKEDVLMIPYGGIKKDQYTGSVTQIEAEDFDKRPLTNFANAVVGASAGVQTTSASGLPGSAARMRFRGFTDVTAFEDQNTPVFVVDGVVYTDDIVDIDPADIAQISLLKDAVALTLYGSRAHNGVVMITTKKADADRSSLNVKIDAGLISRGLPDYDKLDAYTYYPLMWEGYRNYLETNYGIPRNAANNIASGVNSSYNGTIYPNIKDMLVYNPFNVNDNEIVLPNGQLNPHAKLLYEDDLDWGRQLFTGGKQRQHYMVNYAAITKKITSYTSVGYTNEQGYLYESGLKRYSARINISFAPLKWLSMGVNVAGSYINSLADTTIVNNGDNPFYVSTYLGPIYPVHQHDVTGAYLLDNQGSRLYNRGEDIPLAFVAGNNAVRFKDGYSYANKMKNLNVRSFFKVNLLKGLSAISNYAIDYKEVNERRYMYDPYYLPPFDSGVSKKDNDSRGNTFLQQLVYHRQIGQHSIGAMAAYEKYILKLNRNEYSQDFNKVTTLTSSGKRDLTGNLYSLNYGYAEKYILNASYRKDKYGPFPNSNNYALGLGWNLHKEDFLKKTRSINELRIRASYGRLENSSHAIFYSTSYDIYLYDNYEGIWTVNHGSFYDNTYKYGNIGLDVTLFNHKLSGSLEYFERRTHRRYSDKSIIQYAEAMNRGRNSRVLNKGVELSLNYKAIDKKEFRYTTSINLTHFKNRMWDLDPLLNNLISGTKIYGEGRSTYDFYLRHYYGVDAQTGRPLYKTNILNANSRIIGKDTVTSVITNANRRMAGIAIPDIYGAMQHQFSYKKLSLNVGFTYQLGGKMYDETYQVLMSPLYGRALHTDILNRWQNQGDLSNTPRINYGLTYANTDRWLTDASYIQLNTVVISYRLPSTWIGKIKAKKGGVYLSGENLALLSARKGMDVTGSFNGFSRYGYGYNKTISLGVNLGF